MKAQARERSYPLSSETLLRTTGYPALGRYMRGDAVNAAADVEDDSAVTDAEMYRWIRDNRGNYLIFDALRHSDRNEDFDARIRAAIVSSRVGKRMSYLQGK